MRALPLVVFLLSLATSGATKASLDYLTEVESVLRDLPAKDLQRPQVNLKLADALFQEGSKLAANSLPSVAQKSRLRDVRARGIRAYESALTGLGGQFPLPAKTVATRIRFQLARLYQDDGQLDAAERYLRAVAGEESIPELQRESLLRWAELLEIRNTPATLNLAGDCYRKALPLTRDPETESYVHYRLGWVEFRRNDFRSAIREIQLALWTPQGKAREESLRDLIRFIAADHGNYQEGVAIVEKLALRLDRPELLKDLADGFVAAGDTRASIFAIRELHRKKTSLASRIRLLEQLYTIRDWENLSTELKKTSASVDPEAVGALAGETESEKSLRRLTVQLDGERAGNVPRARLFQETVKLYLAAFPREIGERPKMIEGWIAAESSAEEKLAALAGWIQEERTARRENLEIQWRKLRAAIAQKSGKFDVVAAESEALLPLTPVAGDKALLSYQRAYADYQAKNFDRALPEFLRLARVDETTTKIEDWAIRSQHLALDILVAKKSFSPAVEQARTWTRHPKFAAWSAGGPHAEEVKQLGTIENEAEFESASAAGKTPEALAIFDRHCQQGLFKAKSCENARVLAIELAQPEILLRTLRAQDKTEELAGELEAVGEFSPAARLAEKSIAGTRDSVKVALLYELGGEPRERDRVLDARIKALARKNSSAVDDEGLLFATLKDAGRTDAKLLALPWSEPTRRALVNQLDQQGALPAAERARLTKACEDSGLAWEKITVTELKKLDERQRVISFHGANGEARFKKRVAALKTLVDRGNCALESAPARFRFVIAEFLAERQKALAAEIRATPLPEGLDEAGRKSLGAALAEMAQPFEEKAKSFTVLAEEQLAKIPEGERSALKDAPRDEAFLALAPTPSPRIATFEGPVESAAELTPLRARALAELKRDSRARAPIETLKSYYEKTGQPRLAAYFEGRLRALPPPPPAPAPQAAPTAPREVVE